MAVKPMTAKRSFSDWVQEHLLVLALIAVTLAGLAVRVSVRSFVSGDAQEFLLPWYDLIAQQGIGQQVGDYGIPYQTAILLLTFLPVQPLYAYKALSCVFDIVLAVEMFLLVRALTGNDKLAGFAFGAVILLPSVVINSAVWAQCDSIYASFCLAALRRLYQRKAYSSFLLLGIAFAFKLQTVFVLPFFLYVWLLNRDFNIVYAAGCALLGFMVPSIPGFLAGRSVLDPFLIYASQTGIYEYMYLNFPSFWVLLHADYAVFKNVAIAFTAAVLACGLAVLLWRKARIVQPREFLALAAWTAWSCLLFLPAMHERYGYLVYLLLLALAFCDRRFVLVWGIAAAIELATFLHYPFGGYVSLLPLAVVEVALYLGFTYVLFCKGVLPAKSAEQS